MNQKQPSFLHFIIAILTIVIINQLVNEYRTGDSGEREELLTAAMWEITKNDAIKDTLKRIYVEKSSYFQYKYAVVVELKDGTALVYEWEDELKKSIKKSEHSPI